MSPATSRRGTPMGGLEPLLAAREVIVVCGPGGVGKTSTAAAAAVAAAAELGGRILVLTIDPARRLADALGLEALGNVERRVPDDLLRDAGLTPRGELFAAMLDTKQSWDELVRRHAPDEATANRILENRLYANLTSRFVQSHDYIAMERLYELHSSGRYDLIIIDTPPSQSALDFLDAPKRMADFFGGRLLRWLTVPYRVGGRTARVVNAASRPFYQMADRLLGGQFLRDIAEFFVNFESMYDGFVTRAHAVERLLRDRRTAFVVVTTLEGAPVREAEAFCEHVTARRFHLGALVLNRVLPDYLLDPLATDAAGVLAADADRLAELAERGQLLTDEGETVEAAAVGRVLRTMGSSFHDYVVVAGREQELTLELSRLPDVVVKVPTFADDIHDVAGLARVGQYLLGLR